MAIREAVLAWPVHHHACLHRLCFCFFAYLQPFVLTLDLVDVVVVETASDVSNISLELDVRGALNLCFSYSHPLNLGVTKSILCSAGMKSRGSWMLGRLSPELHPQSLVCSQLFLGLVL